MAMPWFIGTINTAYDQALSLNFEIMDPSPQKLLLTTANLSSQVGDAVTMVSLEIPLRGTVMFMPDGPTSPQVRILFGDFGWTYTPMDTPAFDIFINAQGTPLFVASGSSTLVADPGQQFTRWDVAVSSVVGANWEPWNAADGDLASCWSSSPYANPRPAEAQRPWVEVKFATTQRWNGGRVVVFPRWAGSVTQPAVNQPLCFPAHFILRAHTHAGPAATLYDSGDGFEPVATFQAGYCIRTTLIQPPDAVRMEAHHLTGDGSGNYYFQLAEMECYTTPLPIQNIVASSVNTGAGNWAANNLHDGSFTAAWSSEYWANPAAGATLTVDLGVPLEFDRLVLYPRFAAPAGDPDGPIQMRGFPTAFALSVSNDGATWYPLQTVSGLALPPTQNTGIAVALGPQFYRYLQIDITATGSDGDGTVAQLLQVELFQS